MRRFVFRVTLCGALLTLAGCASAPIHFYTLMPPPSATDRASTAAYDIAVLPVTIPAQVDRPQMVVRQGDSSVALLESQRWIAPLGDEIRRALAADLARQLGVQDVYGMAHDEDIPVYRVRVDVKRFESVPGQYTLLAATWDVDAANGKLPAAPCTIHIKEPVGPGYAAIAEGHQHALQALASLIAIELRGVAQGHAIRCHMAAQ